MKKCLFFLMITLSMQSASLCAQVAPASDSGKPAATAAKADVREVTYRWTDRGKTQKLKFDGSWYFQHESAYTTKYQGKRDAKGKAICKPGLTGKYEIFASFRATENRGQAAKYLVDGKLVRTENQRSRDGGGSHTEKFPEIVLGIFELTPDSVVMMNADDGQSYSFTGFRFKPSDGTPSPVNKNSSFGDLIKAEAPQGAVRLTNANQGTREYTVKAAGELAVDALLMTYGPAEMWIKDADGKELLSWKRSNDSDPARLMVNGQAIDGSNVEVKPGDFTPSPQKVKIAVVAGQVISAHLSGEFGDAESYLVINE